MLPSKVSVAVPSTAHGEIRALPTWEMLFSAQEKQSEPQSLLMAGGVGVGDGVKCWREEGNGG